MKKYWLLIQIAVLILLAPVISYGEPSAPDFQKGIEYFKNKKYNEAEAIFNQIIKAEPQNAFAYFYLGQVYKSQKKYDAAIEAYEKAQSLDESLSDLSFQKGLVNYQAQHFENALKEFDLYLKNHPQDASALFYKGVTLKKLDDSQQAMVFLKEASQLDNRFTQPYLYYLGIFHFRNGDLAQAKVSFSDAIQLDSQSDISKQANDYLQNMHTGKRKKKRWWFEAGSSVQYDDNLISSEQDLVSQASDVAFIFEAGGGVRIVDKRKYSSEVEYNFFQSIYVDENEFNLQTHAITFSNNFKAGKYDFGLDYLYYYNFLGGSGFLQTNGFLLSGGREVGNLKSDLNLLGVDLSNPSFYLNLYFLTQLKNFLRDINQIRDGVRYSLGISQSVNFNNGKASFKVGYELVIENTEGPRFDFVGHKFITAGKVPTCFKGKLEFGYSYFIRDYKNITPLIGTDRLDKRHIFDVSWSRYMFTYFEFIISYKHIDSISNFPIVDFKENIATAGIKFLY